MGENITEEFFCAFSIEEDPTTCSDAMKSFDASFWKEDVNIKLGRLCLTTRGNLLIYQ